MRSGGLLGLRNDSEIMEILVQSGSFKSDGVKEPRASHWSEWCTPLNGPRGFFLAGQGCWLRHLHRIFYTVGILSLAYCVVVIFEAALAQSRAREILHDLQVQFASAPARTIPATPAPGAVLASLESPRIGLSVMVLEGTDKRTLRLGAGHLPGSALPWQGGNVVIAGHRDTFFRSLRDIRVGDQLYLTSPEGRHRYQIVWARVVLPKETQALEPTPEASLTLVTCYPFAYVGPAPDRLVIRAVRAETSVPSGQYR
jgi:LPXTG-site transpeptidase (sortase) family protein